MLALALACRSPAADGPLSPDADGDTDAHADTLSASCAVQARNALRVDCTVDVDPPAGVALTFSPSAGGGPERTVRDESPAASHVLVAWRMTAETEYDYTVTAIGGSASAAGTWTTGASPDTAALTVTPSVGTPGWTEDVLVQVPCGVNASDPTAVAFDPAGNVVWYQALDEGLEDGEHSVEATVVTADGRVGAILDFSHVRLFAFDGTSVLDATVGTTAGLDRYVHHDLFARDGHLYVLNGSVHDFAGTDYVTDGVYVMDEATGVVEAEWELTSVLAPSGARTNPSLFWDWAYPGAIDWSHGNGLYVSPDLDVTVSLYFLNGVIRWAGDPGSPDFGTVRWILSGEPTSVLAPLSTMTVDPAGVTPDATFGHQHHPSDLANGDLQLFDNEQLPPTSRILRLALDPGAGVATVTASSALDAFTPTAGSAFVLGNGHLLAMVTQTRELREVDPVSGDVVSVTLLGCPEGEVLDPGILRATPIPL